MAEIGLWGTGTGTYFYQLQYLDQLVPEPSDWYVP